MGGPVRARPPRRVRAARLALVTVVAVVSATGCSRDPQAAYCDTVEEHQKTLTEVAASDDPGSLLDALPPYRELADDAPRDVEADWKQVVDALEGLAAALEEADVDASEYDAAKPPAGVAAEDRQAIERAAEELGSEATVSAMARVEQHALDVCGTPLSR